MDILNALPQNKKFDSVILAVAHEIFKELNITSLLIEKYVIYDVKGMLSVEVDGRL